MKIEIEASKETLEEMLGILENEVPYKTDYSNQMADEMDDVINQILTQISDDYQNN